MFGNFNVSDGFFATKNLAEIDDLIERNEKLLKKLGNADKKEQSDLTQESSEVDYSKLVETCSDGFGGKYILNDWLLILTRGLIIHYAEF